jgi:hypothetical protein
MLATCLLLFFFAELISLTLKMEAICSSETSVETQQTTRRHIPEDDSLHNHHCENLKSYMEKVIHHCGSKMKKLLLKATVTVTFVLSNNVNSINNLSLQSSY